MRRTRVPAQSTHLMRRIAPAPRASPASNTKSDSRKSGEKEKKAAPANRDGLEPASAPRTLSWAH